MTQDAAVPFTPARCVQAMLDVEVALSEALAEVGVIPESSVPPIRAAARADLYDLDALVEDAVGAGNVLIPLVQQLTRRVAAIDATAAGHVHWGATSQDVMDPALVLQLRAAVGDVVLSLTRAADAAADLAGRHVATPMAGRTWLQQATPTTFGAKAATWLDAIARARRSSPPRSISSSRPGACACNSGWADSGAGARRPCCSRCTCRAAADRRVCLA